MPDATGSASLGASARKVIAEVIEFSCRVSETYWSTMESMFWSTSMATPFSSVASGSSVSNWEASSEAGMKWPGRLAWRRPMTSGVPPGAGIRICGQWLAQAGRGTCA